MAVDVDGDGADRAIFQLVVEIIAILSASIMSSWRRRSSVANHSGADLLETLLARKLIGALAAQEDVGAAAPSPPGRG